MEYFLGMDLMSISSILSKPYVIECTTSLLYRRPLAREENDRARKGAAALIHVQNLVFCSIIIHGGIGDEMADRFLAVSPAMLFVAREFLRFARLSFPC